MDINGLPLHPLVVHAAVVFGPLAALAAITYTFVPRWRGWLRWPLTGLVVLATVFIWVAFLTGESFRDSQDFFQSGALGEKIDKHEELAETLRLITSGFAVVTFVTVAFQRRPGVVRTLLSLLMAALGVAVLVWTVLTGDAGAQAVYGS